MNYVVTPVKMLAKETSKNKYRIKMKTIRRNSILIFICFPFMKTTILISLEYPRVQRRRGCVHHDHRRHRRLGLRPEIQEGGLKSLKLLIKYESLL